MDIDQVILLIETHYDLGHDKLQSQATEAGVTMAVFESAWNKVVSEKRKKATMVVAIAFVALVAVTLIAFFVSEAIIRNSNASALETYYETIELKQRLNVIPKDDSEKIDEVILDDNANVEGDIDAGADELENAYDIDLSNVVEEAVDEVMNPDKE